MDMHTPPHICTHISHTQEKKKEETKLFACTGNKLHYQDRSQQRPLHYTVILDKWGITPYYQLSHSAERTTFSILLQNKIVIKYDFLQYHNPYSSS